MFSVIFPGQGSQSVGMAKDLYNKFNTVKGLFNEADDTLKFSITKLIMEDGKDILGELLMFYHMMKHYIILM